MSGPCRCNRRNCMEKIRITTEFIKLDALLKFAGLWRDGRRGEGGVIQGGDR